MRKDIEFINLIEFYSKKDNIRDIYSCLSYEEKMIYKMFVYSLPFMEEDVKDLIWDYVNGFDECKIELSKKHREAKYKLKKRKKIEKEKEYVDEFC